MKNKIAGIITLMALVSATNISFGQAGNAVAYFAAAQVENKIQIDLIVEAGYTCNGILVYRSDDSINFLQIEDVQGICGSNDEPVSYRFFDFTPKPNAINYYRIQLGTLGFSSTIAVRFTDLSESDFVLFPNPLEEKASVYFSNIQNHSVILKIYSLSGILLFESAEARGNSIEFSSANIPNGLSVYTIYFNDRLKYSGLVFK